MNTQDQNLIIYKNLETLQLDLNNLVRKAEEVRQFTQDVSYQATLKRLCTTFQAVVSTRAQKAFFPTPTDQESFERKFKLLRRSTYILHDEMREIRKFITNLHDATRLYKQQFIKKQKIERIAYPIDDELQIIETPQEIHQQYQLPQFQHAQQQQIITLDEEDDVAIVPKQEPEIVRTEAFQLTSTTDPNIRHVSCLCNLKTQLQEDLPFEFQLCIALEALPYYPTLHLNPGTMQAILENPELAAYSDKEDCVSYELIYLLEKHPLQRQSLLPSYSIPYIHLDLDRKSAIDCYFPLFNDLFEMSQSSSIFLHAFYLFSSALKNPQHRSAGHFRFLIRYLHVRLRSASVINAYTPLLDKCQLLADFLNAIYQLNRSEVIIGLNQVYFPELQRNPRIILSRYTRNLNKQEQALLLENVEGGGCRLSSKGTKEPRLFIIFTKEKLYIPSIVQKLKHWEAPVEYLNEISKTYHYRFLIHYIDFVVRSQVKDKYAKFFTLLLTCMRDNLVLKDDREARDNFESLIRGQDFIKYYLIKKVDVRDQSETLLEELLTRQHVNSENPEINRLLGLDH